MIDRTGDYDRHLVVGVRPERLDELRTGRVDPRTLLLEMPEGEWYVVTPESTIDDPLALYPSRRLG